MGSLARSCRAVDNAAAKLLARDAEYAREEAVGNGPLEQGRAETGSTDERRSGGPANDPADCSRRVEEADARLAQAKELDCAPPALLSRRILAPASPQARARRHRDEGPGATVVHISHAFVPGHRSDLAGYERVTAPTAEPALAGMILHVAGPTDEGFRIIDVWRAKRHGNAFRPSARSPPSAAPGRFQPTFRDFRAPPLLSTGPPPGLDCG